MEKNNQQGKRLKLAYMTGIFPTVTTTFIMREAQALADHGLEVAVYAIKKEEHAGIEKLLGSQGLFDNCNYARPDNIFRHLIANLKGFFLHPKRYLRTVKIFLRQIVKMEPGNFVRTMYHCFCGIGFSGDMMKGGVSHIHSHFTAGANMALAANRFSGIPFSWTAHASGDIFIKPVLLEEKMKYASRVIAVCEYSKKYLDSVTGFKYSHKIERIYNGVDLLEVKRLLLEEFAHEDEREDSSQICRLISVGSLIGCKGHATLVEVCKILVERGIRITCVIIGDGPEKSSIKRLIERNHLEDKVFLVNYLPLRKVYAELGKAHIFVHFSEIHINGYRDGFPTVILEAMAMSLPVVSTWISGIPEMVVTGETGFLVHERDAVSAADVVEKLVIDRELRIKFGTAGRERLSKNFNNRDGIERRIELYSVLQK